MKIFLTALLVFCSLSSVFSQNSFRIAEYNTENLFDCEKDSIANDEDFLPHSLRHWNYRAFWSKIQNTAKVIISMSNSNVPPDIVVLTEVENENVLDYLTKRSLLRRVEYDYLITHSADPRGIDVALLYQKGTFSVISYQELIPEFDNLPVKNTRNVLYVKGKVFSGDTIHIFACHFPSKRGGAKVSEPYRLAVAKMISEQIKVIQLQNIRANVVVLGDFNEEKDEPAMINGLKGLQIKKDLRCDEIYNLAYQPNINHPSVKGTYKYNNKWETIDQILISGSLLSKQSQIHTRKNSLTIHCPQFLLQKDESDGGVKPFRTFKGIKFENGFSDHLPIYADFEVTLTK